jgi:hypothetical protein
MRAIRLAQVALKKGLATRLKPSWGHARGRLSALVPLLEGCLLACDGSQRWV